MSQIFWNRCIDKGNLKRLIAWFLGEYGRQHTLELLEELKEMGYFHATRAGISLSIDDLKIPPTKPNVIRESNYEADSADLMYRQGYITLSERLQKMIEVWNAASENLKDQAVDNFLATDPLNPVYMMAFSGARGNISQVRQLVGMRGLMADSAGQLIDLPIQTNFREGLNVTEYVISCFGARKGLVDTALRTANSGYLTRRLVDVAHHVTIRRLDCFTSQAFLLKPLKEQGKVLYSLEERLIGRTLGQDIYQQKTILIAKRNQDLSPQLASQVAEIQPSGVLVRSPLSCEAVRGICRLCYGWNLASSQMVCKGEAVGILAAQSIGEPGTQLTMRTFHTGGVFSGSSLSEQIIAPHGGIIHYDQQIYGRFMRTRGGELAILTRRPCQLSIYRYHSPPTVIEIPYNTILMVGEGDPVGKNHVLGEIADWSSKTISQDKVTKTINADFDGKLYFRNMGYEYSMIQDPEIRSSLGGSSMAGNLNLELRSLNKLHGLTLPKTQELENRQLTDQRSKIYEGQIVLVSGEVFRLDRKAQLFAQPGDLLEEGGTFYTSTILNPHQGHVEIQESHGFICTSFASIQFDGIPTYLPPENGYLEHRFGLGSEGELVWNSRLKDQDPGRLFEWHHPLYQIDTPGTIYYDFVWQEEEDDEEESWTEPSSIFWSPESLNEIHCQEGWTLEALPGDWVEKDQIIATQPAGTFLCQDGILEILDHHLYAEYSGIFDLRVPSLQDMQQGITNCQLTIKPGWLVTGNELQEGLYRDGTVFGLGFPTGQVIVEQICVPDFSEETVHSPHELRDLWEQEELTLLYLIRPVETKPLYSSEDWLIKLLEQPPLTQFTNGRPPGLDYSVNEANLRLEIIQELPWSHGEFVRSGSLVSLSILCVAEDLEEIEPFLEIHPPKAGKPGRLEFMRIGTFPLIPTIGPQNLGQIAANYRSSLLTATGHEVDLFAPLVLNESLVAQGGELVESKSYSGESDEVFFMHRKDQVTVSLAPAYDITNPRKPCIQLGDFVTVGDPIAHRLRSPASGLVVEIRFNQITLQRTRAYKKLIDTKLSCIDQEFVKEGQKLASVKYRQLKTGDIVQGLPKIEELLEARRTRGIATILDNPSQMLARTFIAHQFRYTIQEATLLSFLELRSYILSKVQLIYLGQGVQISDKHLEIIIRQMTCRVSIVRGQHAGYLPGELVNFLQIQQLNENSHTPILYEPVVLGITKAALTTKSFISAASFQETTRVLTQAAIEGKVDWLEGLKENVILGRLIPAGVTQYSEIQGPVSEELIQRIKQVSLRSSFRQWKPLSTTHLLTNNEHFWTRLTCEIDFWKQAAKETKLHWKQIRKYRLLQHSFYSQYEVGTMQSFAFQPYQSRLEDHVIRYKQVKKRILFIRYYQTGAPRPNNEKPFLHFTEWKRRKPTVGRKLVESRAVIAIKSRDQLSLTLERWIGHYMHPLEQKYFVENPTQSLPVLIPRTDSADLTRSQLERFNPSVVDADQKSISNKNSLIMKDVSLLALESKKVNHEGLTTQESNLTPRIEPSWTSKRKRSRRKSMQSECEYSTWLNDKMTQKDTDQKSSLRYNQSQDPNCITVYNFVTDDGLHPVDTVLMKLVPDTSIWIRRPNGQWNRYQVTTDNIDSFYKDENNQWVLKEDKD